MNQKYIFILLIIAQCAHSVEEVYFDLWSVLEPARYISSLLNSDLELGFIIGNIMVVFVGILSASYLFRPNRSFSKIIILSWVIIELVNFSVHVGMAVKRGGYFPGLYTAPFLLHFSALLLVGVFTGVNKQVSPNNKRQGDAKNARLL